MPRFLLAVLVLCVLATDCGTRSGTPGPRYGKAPSGEQVEPYRFAVHPLHNPAKLMEVYRPLMEYLCARMAPARFELEASRDYETFERKYSRRGPEFLLPNPWQTLQAIRSGYHVIAMAGEPRDFCGLIVVRKDATIRRPIDLKGRAISYPAPTALAACIMPQYFLRDSGLDVVRDVDNLYVGSQESSIMNVYLGRTAAGATWPPPWRAFQREHPREAGELRVAWTTPPLINNSIMVRDDVPADVVERVRALLIGLGDTEAGRAILANMETARIIRAEDDDYDLVRTYVARFERDVRKVATK